MSKPIVIDCSCGSDNCRVPYIKINPEEGQLWVECPGDGPKKLTLTSLVYLDRKAFKALVSAGRRGLKRRLAQKR